MFVRSARNLLGYDAKVCYLRSDQGTEFKRGYTVEVLKGLGADLQLSIPDTPQHNSVSERFNQIIQKKVRSYMYDAKLPKSMWDLSVTAEVYAYNRAPHKSNDMIAPLKKFAPHPSFHINQIKRFGCVAYIKVHFKTGPKLRFEDRRVSLSDIPLRGISFQNQKKEGIIKIKMRDLMKNEFMQINIKNEIKDLPPMQAEIDKVKWFVEFYKVEEKSKEFSKL